MPTIGFCPSYEQVIAQVDCLLSRAEQLFGPRDSSYTFEGVSPDVDGPQIIFPLHKTNGVAICFNRSCTQPNYYPDQLLYQLSHETVHLLEPNRFPPTTMLEEGAAVWFSINVPKYWNDGYARDAHERLCTVDANSNYGIAYSKYLQLVALNPDIIKCIRAAGHKLSKATPDIIKAFAPEASDVLAGILSERREMRPELYIQAVPGP